jgi:hypothetical protein
MFATVTVLLLAALPEVGAEVRVDPGKGPGSDLGCLLLIDGIAYAGFCRAWAADDPEGAAEIVNEKRGHFVRAGTKVRVLEYHPGFEPAGVEVRILEGERKGRRAWMPTYYLPSVNPRPRPRN